MDNLDEDIIQILQRDARTPFKRIGKELGKRDTTIHFRTKKLREKKIISRFTAAINPESRGYQTAAILKIEIGGHILPDISKDRSFSFAEELAINEEFIWIAVDKEPMTVYALLMGADGGAIEDQVESLRKTADVVNVDVTPVGKVVKGWEITGWPQ
jgi:DNA-binding Lrp family transcriptional regulator